MVQTTLGNSSISARCGILAISITIAALTIVRSRRIGALNIPLRIGALSGVVTLVAAFKADNAGSRGKSVGVSSGTIVAIGVVVVVDVWAGDIVVAVGTVGIVGTWCLWWSISRLGC